VSHERKSTIRMRAGAFLRLALMPRTVAATA
jgi:hypothetical protein